MVKLRLMLLVLCCLCLWTVSVTALGDANSYLSLRTGAAPWAPRLTGTLTMWQGTLWMFGGQFYNGTGAGDVWNSGDFGNTWTQVTQPRSGGFGPCANGVTAQAFGQLIFWCGTTTSSNIVANDVYFSTDKQLAIWTHGAASWSPRKWTAVAISACATGTTSVIVSGGRDVNNAALNDVWWVNVSGNYQQLTVAGNTRNGNGPWFGARWAHASVNDAAMSVMIVTGGYSQLGSAYLNDVWSMTLECGSVPIVTWTQLTAAASFQPRNQHEMWAINDYIYVAAGYLNGGQFNDVWSSADYGTTWLLVSGAANFVARYGAMTAINGRQVILVGGVSTTGIAFNDVYVGFN